ncbi:cytochrome P450 [Serendipita vermifera]|nr:cytochrome P450 [Serendipita vermifera]
MDGIWDIVGGYLSKPTTVVAVMAIILGRIVWDELKFRRIYGSADYRPAFNPLTVLGITFGLGMHFSWEQRSTLYPKKGREYIVLKPWAWGDPIVYTNSVDILKQVAGGGTMTAWQKPEWAVSMHLYWGRNLLAAHDAEWRKHRKVMQPAFNPNTYEMVWNETLRLYNQMLVAEKFPTKKGEKSFFPAFQDITQRIALCIILSCGFGIPFNWDERDTPSTEEGFRLDNGVRVQSDNMMWVLYAPRWLYKLPSKKMKYIDEGTKGLRAWFQRAMVNKQTEIDENIRSNEGEVDPSQFRNDVFTRLNLAHYIDKKLEFADSEIIGNTWVMFFAGHETTAGSLAATFCLLAAHPEEQEIVYKEVKDLMSKSGTDQLSFDDYDSLLKTRAVFTEALRMYPPAHIAIRECKEDTVLKVPFVEEDGTVREENVPFSKGTILVNDFIGMQYNPRIFPEPHAFKPSRWYNNTSDDAYTVFSVGPRTCIGRKFSLTEGVCWIAHLLRNFTVKPLLSQGESVEGWKERVLETGTFKLSFALKDAPLVFKRR